MTLRERRARRDVNDLRLAHPLLPLRFPLKMNAPFRSPAVLSFDNEAIGDEGDGTRVAQQRALRDIAWRDAAEAPELDPAIWRVDRACHPMRHDDFENADSPWGWTIRPRDSGDEDAAGFDAVAYATLRGRL